MLVKTGLKAGVSDPNSQLMMADFHYGLALYRIRYGDGEITTLLAQSAEQARVLGETARPGSVVVDTAAVESRP
jgi:hypothetical protein